MARYLLRSFPGNFEPLQLDAFQEEPYLLDPYLEPIVHLIMSQLRASFESPQLLSNLATLAYFCTKVRGYKIIGEIYF